MNGQPLGKLQSIPDACPGDEEEDDSAQDRRYAIDVAHDQGQSTVYVMATSVGEVKRNMRQKAGYVVLAIRVHGEEKVSP